MSFLPPATIGIIGGGQLGMMLVREAHRMGYKSIVWDPAADCPASRIADQTLVAPFVDRETARALSSSADVVTYEFENIDSGVVGLIEMSKPVYPGAEILRVTQHRRIEKEELRRRNFPVVRYAGVSHRDEFQLAVKDLGTPLVLKTSTSGYDGKGQVVFWTQSEARDFGERLPDHIPEYVLEEFLHLQCELSVMVARGADGSVKAFPVAENEHRENILHISRIPARVSEQIRDRATTLAMAIIESFELVGMLGVEFFVTADGDVLVNELAPRPHNSGHYTLDVCNISQFEMLIRAVCGLHLPSPRLLSPVVMVNILGKHLSVLDIEDLLRFDGVKLHLYGKTKSEPRRKMGHITVVSESLDKLEQTVRDVEQIIGEAEQVSR